MVKEKKKKKKKISMTRGKGSWSKCIKVVERTRKEKSRRLKLKTLENSSERKTNIEDVKGHDEELS